MHVMISEMCQKKRRREAYILLSGVRIVAFLERICKDGET